MARRHKAKSSEADTAQELWLFGPEHLLETEQPPTPSHGASLADDMLWAVGYIDKLELDDVRMIAMETSMTVQNGVNPATSYIVNALSGRRLDGQRVAVLCYAAFRRAFPSMVDHLNIDYYDAYDEAFHRLFG